MTFSSPFTLPGLEGLQPAGTYVVETDEELLEQLSFTAYHRISTSIVVPLGGESYQMIKVAPEILEAAREGTRAASPGPDVRSGVSDPAKPG
jgi:hypothetical protein